MLRRLRSRLAIAAERLQVICTSASFSDDEHARRFAAQLTGKDAEDFRTVRGELRSAAGEAKGSEADARALARLSIDEFYEAASDIDRIDAASTFLEYRGVTPSDELGPALYAALEQFPR